MNPTESLKDYKRVRTLAIRSLFEIIEQSSDCLLYTSPSPRDS